MLPRLFIPLLMNYNMWRGILVDLFMDTVDITNQVALIRLAFSFLAGGLVGFERSYRRQNAGLRTHILICIGSTLLMLLSMWVTERIAGVKSGDPGRIAAQVVSGIGFLGAGSIIRLGNTMKGLTTAASIWFVAALGLAIGAGMYIPSLFALAIVLFSLVVLDPIERYFFPSERFKHLIIAYSGDSDLPEKARRIIEMAGIPVQSVDAEKNMKKNVSVVRFLVRVTTETDTTDLYRMLKDLGGVEKVELKEKF